jgi:hypothetical protein
MRSVKPCMSLNSLKVVYYSYFNSVVINYGFPFGGNSAPSVQIFRMQNNIVRIMLGCKRRVSCRNLFMKLKILLSSSQYIFFLIHSLIKSKNQFTVNSDIHNINTRQHYNFHQPMRYVTKYIKRIYYLGLKVYSNLPSHTTDTSNNPKNFELWLKQFLSLYFY